MGLYQTRENANRARSLRIVIDLAQPGWSMHLPALCRRLRLQPFDCAQDAMPGRCGYGVTVLQRLIGARPPLVDRI